MSNPLIQKYTAVVGSSELSRKGKAWKKLRRQFLDSELLDIERRNARGEAVTILRTWYKDLIMTCGTQDDKTKFEKRTGMFRHIPAKERTRAQIAREEFENFVGDESQASSWHKLFKKLRIQLETLPTTVSQCKKLLRENRVYVNIFDFVDRLGLTGKRGRVRKFKSFWALKDYSINTGKIFPLFEAKEDSALRILLQPLLTRR